MSFKNLQSYIDNLTSIVLSDKEKSSMRRRIADHVDANSGQYVWADWSIFTYVRGSAVATALMLFLLGGVSLAAENTLPGDALYAVKTNVNEQFLRLAALSPQSEAETESRLAARRVTELQALADRGNLTQARSDELKAAIAKQITAARKDIESISENSQASSTEVLTRELSSALESQEVALKDFDQKEVEERETSASSSLTATLVLDEAKAKAESTIALVAENESVSQGVQIRSRSSASSSDELLAPQMRSEIINTLALETTNAIETAAEKVDDFDTSSSTAPIANDLRDIISIASSQANRAVNLEGADNLESAAEFLQSSLFHAYIAEVTLEKRQNTSEETMQIVAENLRQRSRQTSAFISSTGSSTATTSVSENVNRSSTDDANSVANQGGANHASSSVNSSSTVNIDSNSESRERSLNAENAQDALLAPLKRNASGTTEKREFISSQLEKIRKQVESPRPRNADGRMLPPGVPVDDVRER